MRYVETKGCKITPFGFKDEKMVVRTETTQRKKGKFSTLSISDEKQTIMLQVVVTDELRKILKSL